MELRTSPEETAPGQTSRVRLTLLRDGVAQRAFAPGRDAPLHLSVVSRDFQDLQHLHPAPDPASGEFEFPVTVTRASPYLLLADFTLPDQTLATVRGELDVRSSERVSPELTVDDGPRRVGRYTVTPEVASPLVAGVDLIYIASVTRDGTPRSSPLVIDRTSAHIVILSADSLRPVPTSAVVRGGHGGMLSLDPNQVAFATKIPRPGRYVLFTEIPADGEMVSARNVYDVIAPPVGAGAELPDAMTHEMGDGSAMAGEMLTVPIEAFQWGFAPSTIRVKRDTHLKVVLTSRDVPHSFTLPDYDVSQTIVPGKTSEVDFVADRPGSFAFGCDVACGSGHTEMQRAGGVLIVE